MTQPPQYPGQPEYQGQPGDPYGQPGQPPQAPPGQAWPPPPPVQDPFVPPTSAPPTSAPPTSGQPYYQPGQPYQDPSQQYPQQPYQDPSQQYQQPYPPTGQFPPQTGQFPTGPVQQTGVVPPFSGPPFSGPPGAPTSGFPGYQPAPPKKKRGLMITLIVLAVVVVLCGGGGAAAYFVVNGNTGKGQPSAVEAVNGFLKAVYKDKNTDDALKFVCASARKKDKLAARVDEIRKYDAALSSPTYTWPAPTVDKQENNSATLTVPVKVATSDEKVAETKYKFLATNDNGWWVCEITAA
jgi:flagellar basal body-associated protein FliL